MQASTIEGWREGGSVKEGAVRCLSLVFCVVVGEG